MEKVSWKILILMLSLNNQGLYIYQWSITHCVESSNTWRSRALKVYSITRSSSRLKHILSNCIDFEIPSSKRIRDSIRIKFRSIRFEKLENSIYRTNANNQLFGYIYNNSNCSINRITMIKEFISISIAVFK